MFDFTCKVFMFSTAFSVMMLDLFANCHSVLIITFNMMNLKLGSMMNIPLHHHKKKYSKMILVGKHVIYIGSFFSIASVKQTQKTEQEDRHSELQAPPPQSEEESSNLIRPQKPLNPLTASRSHRELHRELRMTNKRYDRHTNSHKHSHFSFIDPIYHKVLLCFC